MRFVHAADLHLDSPLRGLARYEGAPVDKMRGATRRALENLVALCETEGAELLLLAGDLFDGGWRDYATGLFFAAQMSRLREAGTLVVFVRGNHDAESRITRSLKMPENVLELRASAPETRVLDRLGVAVHGQSFAERAITVDLAARYPAPIAGALNIGILHTSASGRAGHEPYAPTSTAIMAAKGYDYWALGHVHAREVLSEAPWIVFPGNLQGRHAREAGAKGATLVTAVDGRITAVERRTLDAVRWTVCDVDVSEATDAGDAIELARRALAKAALDAEERPLAARIRLVGTTAAHDGLVADAERWQTEVRAAATDLGEAIWIEKVRLETRPLVSRDALAARDDAIGQLARALRELDEGGSDVEALFAKIAEPLAKLPLELREGDEGLRLDDPEVRRALLRDVADALLPRLLAGERE